MNGSHGSKSDVAVDVLIRNNFFFCLIQLIFKSVNTHEKFYADISTLEDETTSLSENVGNQISGGEASSHIRRTVTCRIYNLMFRDSFSTEVICVEMHYC
jgi:hypothetical protein